MLWAIVVVPSGPSPQFVMLRSFRVVHVDKNSFKDSTPAGPNALSRKLNSMIYLSITASIMNFRDWGSCVFSLVVDMSEKVIVLRFLAATSLSPM